MLNSLLPTLDFHLPTELEATAPPEARGVARDDVRLLVSSAADDWMAHTHFKALGDFLEAGDVLVINTSATLPAAVGGQWQGQPIGVHFSTQPGSQTHVVELRVADKNGSHPFYGAQVGDVVKFSEPTELHLLAPYNPKATKTRLWLAHLKNAGDFHGWLQRHGRPIRYDYVSQPWPLAAYQTVFANEAGSAEMPSAGRAFSAEIVTKLVAKGIVFAPLLLHTGVASLEDHEPPYAEFYRVPAETARQINMARSGGKRIIAIGTTAARALESCADENGWVTAGSGWTTLVIGGSRPRRVINGLLTGFHEPKATHLAMLRALTGEAHLQKAYTAALEKRYLWHEFGDLHLIL